MQQPESWLTPFSKNEVPVTQDRPDRSTPSPDPMAVVRDALSTLKFGAISLTVHEGKLVQIEVTEKRRFV